MSKRAYMFWGSLALTLVAPFLLGTGSSLLTLGLNSANTIPLGTFITWMGMIGLPMSIYWSAVAFRKPKGTWQWWLSRLLKVSIGLAILWVPIAFLLSGNLAFTFS